MKTRNAQKIAALAAVVVTGVTGTGIAAAQADTKSLDKLASSCSVSSTPTIKSGSTGAAVKSAQCLLNAKGGYKLAVDGEFGPKTKAAVRDFQGKQKLEVDGIVGPKTWGKLTAGNDGGQNPNPSSRQQTLDRAATWLTAYNGGPVPYSQSSYFQGYRQDCSGYVSMALNLGTSPNTVGLADSQYTRKISMSELKPGDLIIDYQGTNTTRHVVIFEKWNDSSKSSYTAYEQTGDGDKTRHRTLKYGLESNSEYEARRPVKYGD